jgi:hypothetical protein
MHGPKHDLREFYLHEFARVKELNRVWEVLLQKKYPKVAKHLTDLRIDPMLYTPAWFLTGFQTMQLPPPFRLRMFDRHIVFGTRALLSFAVTIISIGKKSLETKSTEVCIPLLQNPMSLPEFQDWRNLIKKFDTHFLTKQECSSAFKRASIEEFP